jgi:hypothetical protein
VTAVRLEVAPGQRSRLASHRVPQGLAAGRYRLRKDVHPPFERQGVQPAVTLYAEFDVSGE